MIVLPEDMVLDMVSYTSLVGVIMDNVSRKRELSIDVSTAVLIDVPPTAVDGIGIMSIDDVTIAIVLNGGTMKSVVAVETVS